MSATAITDQRKILEYLSKRIAHGDARYCTIPTIKKHSGVEGSNQYILALTDDLETSGFIITRQSYQMSGGRLFQATARGLALVENGDQPVSVDSSLWTGRYHISETQRGEIASLLTKIRSEIEASKLSNAKKANALALVRSAEILVEAPDPPWPEIMRLLRSPVLGNILAIAGFIFSIVQILVASAGS